MGRHSQSSANFRHKYPVLAASAVLAVAGVSSFLIVGGGPTLAALTGGQSPAAGSSSAGTTGRGAQSEDGFSAFSASSSGAVQRYTVGSARNQRYSSGRYPITGYSAPAAGPSRYSIPTVAPRITATATTPTVTPTVTATSTPSTTASATPTADPSGSGQFFGLAPVGTQLPRSDAYCAAQVKPMAENVAANTTANHTVPSGPVQFGPWAQHLTNFTHVDGNFTGTTGEILEWAACKWGWNQDYAFAEAVLESNWIQSTAGDGGHSFGILQVKASPDSDSPTANLGWGGYPWTQKSTALNADAQMAYLSACYNGDTPWLGNGYAAGDAWGCIGSWYSGDWHSGAANGYISRVQASLTSQAWKNV
jgi:hypothetical protein